jgi:hypothetical protein
MSTARLERASLPEAETGPVPFLGSANSETLQHFGGTITPVSFLTPERIVPSAWLGHAPFGFWIVHALKPKSIVELGTYTGFSYSVFCQAVQCLGLNTSCHAVDTWTGDEHTGFYGPEVLQELRSYHDERYSAFSRLVQSTFAEASNHFLDGSVDLLHIDGLHSYEAVRGDFERWKPKLSSSAVVLLHYSNVKERGFGVFRLWHELKATHDHFEFVHAHGLGVLGVGDHHASSVAELFAASFQSPKQRKIRDGYAKLGLAITDRAAVLQLETELATQQRQLATLQQNHREQTEQTTSQRSSIAAKLSATEVELQKAQSELAEIGTQRTELLRGLEATASKLTETQLALEKAREDSNALSAQCATDQLRFDEISSKLECANARISEQKSSLRTNLIITAELQGKSAAAQTRSARLQELAENRAAEPASLKVQISASEEEVDRFRTAERDDIHAELGRRTAERDEIHAELVRRTAERDDVHAALVHRTAERGDIHAELVRRTAERHDIHAELVRSLARKPDQKAGAKRLKTKLEQTRLRLGVMQKSRSWRLTAPFRNIALRLSLRQHPKKALVNPRDR